MTEKFDYQKIYEQFSVLNAGALFLRDNNEKLKIVFSLINKNSDDIDFVVWIAPSCYLATNVYVGDIKQAAGGWKDRIEFFSTESLSFNDEKYLALYNLTDKYRVFCIVDESLTFKNTTSGRTRRLLTIKHKFKYRILLSKNPLSQGIRDLYAQAQFLDSSILNMTEAQFLHRFLPLYIDDFDVWKRDSNPAYEGQVVSLVRPYLLACDFQDNLRIEYHERIFDLTEKEQEAYRRDKEAFLAGREQVAYLQVVQRFQYFYTICKRKVEALAELVNEITNRGEKVIIYTKYLSEVKFLKESGIFKKGKFVIMSGSSNKTKALDLFENEINIMICTYKVESPRLNLKGCNNIIYFSQTFDYKDKLHTLSRFYHQDVVSLKVYDFWVNTRLENLIKDNIARKKSLLKSVCKMMSCDEALDL